MPRWACQQNHVQQLLSSCAAHSALHNRIGKGHDVYGHLYLATRGHCIYMLGSATRMLSLGPPSLTKKEAGAKLHPASQIAICGDALYSCPCRHHRRWRRRPAAGHLQVCIPANGRQFDSDGVPAVWASFFNMKGHCFCLHYTIHLIFTCRGRSLSQAAAPAPGSDDDDTAGTAPVRLAGLAACVLTASKLNHCAMKLLPNRAAVSEPDSLRRPLQPVHVRRGSAEAWRPHSLDNSACSM